MWALHFDFLRMSRMSVLTSSMKFITKTFLKYSFSIRTGRKKIEFLHFLINVREIYQGRPNNILKWPLHGDVLGTTQFRNCIIKHILFCFFFSIILYKMCYIKYWKVICCIFWQLWRNVLRTLNTSWSDVHRFMFLGSPQGVSFEHVIQMLFCCIIFNPISLSLYLKH